MDPLPSTAARPSRPRSGPAKRPQLGWSLGSLLSSFPRTTDQRIDLQPSDRHHVLDRLLDLHDARAIPAESPGVAGQPNPGLDEELPRPPGARPARLVVQRRLARAGDRAGARDPVFPGSDLPVVALSHARVVLASCSDRRHDLPGGSQCGRSLWEASFAAAENSSGWCWSSFPIPELARWAW